jgi:hypothetical protein
MKNLIFILLIITFAFFQGLNAQKGIIKEGTVNGIDLAGEFFEIEKDSSITLVYFPHTSDTLSFSRFPKWLSADLIAEDGTKIQCRGCVYVSTKTSIVIGPNATSRFSLKIIPKEEPKEQSFEEIQSEIDGIYLIKEDGFVIRVYANYGKDQDSLAIKKDSLERLVFETWTVQSEDDKEKELFVSLFFQYSPYSKKNRKSKELFSEEVLSLSYSRYSTSFIIPTSNVLFTFKGDLFQEKYFVYYPEKYPSNFSDDGTFLDFLRDNLFDEFKERAIENKRLLRKKLRKEYFSLWKE